MSTLTTQTIADFLTKKLAEILDIESTAVESNVAFARYGVDSAAAVELTSDLKQMLGVDLEPTLLYEYPTIDELSNYLAGIAKTQTAEA